jgi:hypothetical protein
MIRREVEREVFGFGNGLADCGQWTNRHHFFKSTIWPA